MQHNDNFMDLFNSVKDNKDHLETKWTCENETESINSENGSNDTCCIDCTDSILEYLDGAYFCNKCGLFQEIRINQDQEWRFYGDSDTKNSDPTRVGMPTNILLPESSLGTIISKRGNRSIEFDKMRQYHTWNTMPYKERSLYRVYDTLQTKAIKAGIPACIINNAKIMYKEISETQISRGSNRRGLMASCIYISCKLDGVPRSAKEIAGIYGLKVSEMTKGCKKFLEIMNLNKKSKKYVISNSNPMNFIKRFCSKIGLSDNIYYICEYVTIVTTKLDIVDENTPPSIAAGGIFLVITLCNLDISKKMVAKACKTSEVTISKCYKKLYSYRLHLFPPSVITKYNIK